MGFSTCFHAFFGGSPPNLATSTGESMLNMMICARTRMHRRLQPDLSPGTMFYLGMFWMVVVERIFPTTCKGREREMLHPALQSAWKHLRSVKNLIVTSCYGAVSHGLFRGRVNIPAIHVKGFLIWDGLTHFNSTIPQLSFVTIIPSYTTRQLLFAQVMGRVLLSGCFFLCGVHLRTGTFQRGDP